MKRLLLALILATIGVSSAYSQTRIGYTTSGTNTITVSPTNPLPVTGSFIITFPTIGAAVPTTGIYNGINVAGTLRGVTGLSLGSTYSQTIAIVDASGNQITSFGSSAAVGPTGSAVPASASYVGINVGGNLTGWTGAVTNAGTFAVQATQSGTWNLTNISGTISLPTGAATSALQTTGNTSLSTIATNTAWANTNKVIPWDGTTNVTVKPASTASVSTDTSLVVGINPNSLNANGQATMANSAPTVLASNQSVADPCMFQAKTNLPINQNGTSSVQLIPLSGSTSIYVCSLSLVAAGATTVAITTGTGTACVTGNAAVIGTTTAGIANSISFAANGGLTLGNGQGTIAKGAASSELCMILGTSVYVSGNLTYVQQ